MSHRLSCRTRVDIEGFPGKFVNFRRSEISYGIKPNEWSDAESRHMIEGLEGDPVGSPFQLHYR